MQLWLVVGVFLMATTLRMFATCQQLQAQARAHAAAASGILNHTELRLHMPPSIAFATRGRLQGLRLQLALLDREFDDLGTVFLSELYFLDKFCHQSGSLFEVKGAFKDVQSKSRSLVLV